MTWLLEHKLKKLSRRADPDPRFVHRLEKDLRAAMGQQPWWVQPKTWAVSALSAALLVSGGAGVYAYESEQVLPDHPLYGFKQRIERVEEKLAYTPEKKVTVQLKHLKRRLREQQLLQAKQKPIAQEPLNKFQEDLERVVDQAEPLPQPVRKRVQDAVTELETSHEVIILREQGDAEVLEHIRKKMKKLLEHPTTTSSTTGGGEAAPEVEYPKEDVLRETQEDQSEPHEDQATDGEEDSTTSEGGGEEIDHKQDEALRESEDDESTTEEGEPSTASSTRSSSSSTTSSTTSSTVEERR